MKKIMTIVLSLALFLTVLSISAQAANRGVAYKPSVTEVYPGDEVVITMSFDDYDNVSAYNSELEFNDAEIELSKKPQSSISSMIFDFRDNAIICGFSDATDLSGNVAAFTFKVSESVEAGNDIAIIFKTRVSRKGEADNDVLSDNVIKLKVKAVPCEHTTVKVEAVASTCKTEGTVEHYTCTKCHKNFSDEAGANELDDIAAPLDPTNHTGKTEIKDAKPATEDEEGYTGDTYCSDCGKKIKEGEAIAKLDHTHSMTKVSAVSATCTKDGTVAHYHCSKCGNNYTDEAGTTKLESIVDKSTGHKIVVKNQKDATCTEAGYSGDEICTVCGETVKKGEEIKPNGHTEEVVAGKEATCTEGGLTEGKKCSVCQAVLVAQEETKALGHDYEKTVVSPTCTEQGYTNNICSRCQDSFKSDETPAKGHTETEVAQVPTTCTEDGAKAGKKCSECGEILEGLEKIPALGHTTEIRGEIPVTETTNGYTGDTYCKVCGQLISKGSVIQAQTKNELIGYMNQDDDCHVVFFTNGLACTALHVYGSDGRCVCGALKKLPAADIPEDTETITVNDPIESNTTDEEDGNTEAAPSDNKDENPKTGIALTLVLAVMASAAVLLKRR